MMLSILGLLIPALGKVLDKYIPDAAQRAQVQEDMTKELLANEAAVMDAAKSVMQSDQQSESWMTRNMRPIVVAWGLVMITVVVISPAFGAQDAVLHSLQAIPGNLWDLVTYGVGIWMVGRSAEKIAGSVVGKPGR